MAVLSQLTGSLAVALDNTRRLEELETAADKLSSTRTLLLEQQRLADAGKLAMGLAHEIRNPLTGINSGHCLLFRVILAHSVRQVLESSRDWIELDDLLVLCQEVTGYSISV